MCSIAGHAIGREAASRPWFTALLHHIYDLTGNRTAINLQMIGKLLIVVLPDCRKAAAGLRVKTPGLETDTAIKRGEALQIESLYRRAALRHRISSRSARETSAKLFSIMRMDSG